MLMPSTPRESKRGKRLDMIQREPFPDGFTFTIRGVALRFGKHPQTIYNLLWKRASEFSSPKYAQMHLRGRGDCRFYRVLTEADMLVLRTIFSVRVKG